MTVTEEPTGPFAQFVDEQFRVAIQTVMLAKDDLVADLRSGTDNDAAFARFRSVLLDVMNDTRAAVHTVVERLDHTGGLLDEAVLTHLADELAKRLDKSSLE